MGGRARPWASGCCLVALCALSAAPMAAQNGQLEVRHTGADSLSVQPGARASAAFRIINRGTTPVSVRIGVDLPQGWRAATPATDLALPADTAVVRVVSFFPPTDAPAAEYLVVLSAQPPSGAPVADTVRARVPADPRLRVVVEEAPRWVGAGEPYTATFRVENAGNVELPVRLVLDSPGGFDARASAIELRLDPGASSQIDVRVETSGDLAGALTHLLQLQAVAPDATAQAVARVEVVPQGRGASLDRGGLPAELRLRLSDDARAGSPVRLRASGPLSAGSSTNIDLLLQGPAQEYSVFGESDVYRLRLDAPLYSLYLGDQVFSLSELTEPGREGLGVEARARAGPLEVGGYAQKNRRSFRPDTQFAAYARLPLGSPVEVRGNWFRRYGGNGLREVWSLEGAVHVPGWLDIDGEYGRRPANGAEGRSVDLRGGSGPISVGVRHLHVDSAYGGSYAGLSLDGAHASLRPWRHFYVESSIEDQRLARRTLTHPLERSLRSGRVALGYGSYLALEGRYLADASSFGGRKTEREARSARIQVGLPLGPLRVFPSFEAGVGDDATDAGDSDPFWRAGLRTDLRTGPASLSSTVEYFTGGTLHRSLEEEGMAGMLTGSLRLGGATRVHVSAYGARYLAPVERENLVVNARFEQGLPFGHQIVARVLSRSTSGLFESRETVFMVDYAIPLKLPIGRVPEGVSTVVRVYDAETGGPVSGVVVAVGGRRVATDGDGRAVLSSLGPGPHYVEIDRATAGSSRVPTVPLPHRLASQPGASTTFEIGLIQAATLLVRTRLARAPSFRGADSTAIPIPEPLPRVLVELAREGERIRRPTDQIGRLELRDLRPGRWSITVAAAELPPFHRFEQDTVVVEIAPAGVAEVELLAVPVQRRVRIVASGEVSDRPTDEEARAPAARAPAPRPEVAPPEPTPSRRSPPEQQPRPPAADPRPPPAAPARPGETGPGWSTFRTSERTGTLMEVARQVYLQMNLWPKIWLANRDRVPDPDAVPAGISLRIPPKAPLTREERRVHFEYYRRPPGR